MKKLVLTVFIFLFKSIHAQEVEVQDSVFKLKNQFDVIKIFPNPTSEILFIRNGDLIDSYQLIDMSGTIVQKGVHETQIISLIDLPIGSYFLILEIDGFFERFRIQKY